jgi:3-hydroxy-9,10-secoandrosta-1,3,5(10)-triene-9,17-dione monooxygenase reductase component
VATDNHELEFRRAMGAFATGVAVVSAAADARLYGVTVNSLTSVSLSPRLLLWSLGDRSQRYEVFANAAVWGVTILGADEEALARRFANVSTSAIDTNETLSGFAAPVLQAGIAHFACRTHERIQAGDHLILVGEVGSFRAEPGAGLTFFRGRYGAIDDV